MLGRFLATVYILLLASVAHAQTWTGGAPVALVVPPGAVTTVGTTAVTVLPAGAVTRALLLGNPSATGSGTLYCTPVGTAVVNGTGTIAILPGGLFGLGPTDAGLGSAWSCIASVGTILMTVLGF